MTTTRLARLLLATLVIGHCALVISPPALRAATDAQLSAVATLIQKGDVAAARAALDGLLALEPGDATLKALRAQLGEASPAQQPASAEPAPAKPSAPAGPDMPRLDRLELQTIQSLLAEAKTREDFETIARRTDGLLARYPDYYDLWLLRAGTAAALNDETAGYRATLRLLDLGILDRTAPQSEKVLLAINKKDWIAASRTDKARAEAAARAEKEKQDRKDAFRRSVETGTDPLTFTMNGNSLSVEFKIVPIEPGTFRMGSETGSDNEKPVRTVTLTRRFWLGETEVTQELYQAVTGKTPSYHKSPKRPVENVSYDDALTFCEALNTTYVHILPAGWKFTLPTEAQWEYACRAGTTGDYAGDLEALAWFEKTSWNANTVKAYSHRFSRSERKALIGQPRYISTARIPDSPEYFKRLNLSENQLIMRQDEGNITKPVAGRGPNAWGLYDMHGNVTEWCLDWYGNYQGSSVADPMGPSSGSDRVHRGGSNYFSANGCRSTIRFYGMPNSSFSTCGFRVALSSGQ